MANLVSLIAATGSSALDGAVAREAAGALGAEPHWLAESEALELATELPAHEARTRLGAILAGRPVDIVALPEGPRRKRLLVCDMDSTIITVECIDELAAHVGLRERVSEITRRAMNGEIDFESALCARVALLAGLPESALEEVYRERVRLMPGARTLVATMKGWGAVTALVSGGFTYFTGRVRAECGFDLDEANVLEVRDGRLTGRLVGPIRDHAAKRATLERLMREHGSARAETLAVGDGANDLSMLQAAGLGVGFRPHEHVERRVAATIRHGDLTALLYLQGVPRHAFRDA